VAALDLTKPPMSKDALVPLHVGGHQVLMTVRRKSHATMTSQATKNVSLSEDVHGERVVFKQSYGALQHIFPEIPDQVCEPINVAEVLAGEVPLAKALSFMLRLGTIGLGCPVEIEFALKLRRSNIERHELHLLQIRPQAQVTAQNAMGLRFQYLPSLEYAAITSKAALGNGRFGNIRDVVYVSPERFDRSSTHDIAREISEINAQLQTDGRKYLLVAPGRWGSADSTRGIPVGWKDINGSSFIVETSLPGAELVPLSQGSHFFQNLISFGLGYANVESSTPKSGEVADYGYWDAMPAKGEGRFVRHVQLESPLEIVVDGLSRHGVVMKQGKPFDVYVAQVDAFMALNEPLTHRVL